MRGESHTLNFCSTPAERLCGSGALLTVAQRHAGWDKNVRYDPKGLRDMGSGALHQSSLILKDGGNGSLIAADLTRHKFRAPSWGLTHMTTSLTPMLIGPLGSVWGHHQVTKMTRQQQHTLNLSLSSSLLH
ncbi:hypothetical protein MHYP_G00063660 [Metynnis hypsauchen]